MSVDKLAASAGGPVAPPSQQEDNKQAAARVASLKAGVDGQDLARSEHEAVVTADKRTEQDDLARNMDAAINAIEHAFQFQTLRAESLEAAYGRVKTELDSLRAIPTPTVARLLSAAPRWTGKQIGLATSLSPLAEWVPWNWVEGALKEAAAVPPASAPPIDELARVTLADIAFSDDMTLAIAQKKAARVYRSLVKQDNTQPIWPPASAWRAIASAPKDRPILTWRGVGLIAVAEYFPHGESQWCCTDGVQLLNVTHWMELPDPPARSAEA